VSVDLLYIGQQIWRKREHQSTWRGYKSHLDEEEKKLALQMYRTINTHQLCAHQKGIFASIPLYIFLWAIYVYYVIRRTSAIDHVVGCFPSPMKRQTSIKSVSAKRRLASEGESNISI
jgi:hypothetical protein